LPKSDEGEREDVNVVMHALGNKDFCVSVGSRTLKRGTTALFLGPLAVCPALAQTVQSTARPEAPAVQQANTAQDTQQDTAPTSTSADQASDGEGEILVTGSRAAVQGYAAPTPMQVVGSDLIERQGATTIGQVLYQNPAFKATRTPGATAGNVSNPGQATADLRALGGQRTLVLFNGSRIVPQASANNLGVPVATDTNLIPTMMIERVEVVTGGASAQYGSDAVAGVVNILTKRRMSGIRLTAQAGMSQYGDAGNYRIGAIGGFGFAEDRGQVIASVEFSQSDRIGDVYNRDWGRERWQIVSNAGFATNGQPAFVLAPGVNTVLGTGGVITGPANFALAGQTFNADGSLRPFQYGTIRNATLQVGGEGPSFSSGGDLLPGVKRVTAYGRAEFAVSDKTKVYLEGGYSRSHAMFFNNIPSFSAVTIRNDNAYLPGAVRTALANQGLTSFAMTKVALEIGNNRYDVFNSTPHGTVGIEGGLGGSWRYDAHYSYGVNNYRSEVTNNLVTPNTAFAVDAVVNPANGQIVCRATLPGAAFNAAAAGCVPINLFGPGNVSPQARAYVARSGFATAKYRQHSAAANLRGEPFSTWAGPVAMAIGVEYRREDETVRADALAAVNAFTASGNAAPFAGKFDVKEGYVEAIVPLARDLHFARQLDLNGAIRYADYSTVDGQTTWKVGAVYEPFDGLRFRTTLSRDIRAPAIWELFSPGSEVTNQVTVRGNSPRVPQNTSRGNPNLDPEKGDTWTAGIVIEPRGALSGLRASVDYYDIKLSGAITTLTAANLGTLCTQGIQQFCDYFTFDAAGVATRLVAPTLNLGEFRNRGIDGTLAYSVPMSALGSGGRYTTNFSGTYILKALVNTGVPGTAPIDRAGENGQQNLGAIPRFRGNLSTTFATDGWSLTAQMLYVSKGKIDNTYNTRPNLTINDNTIPAVAYVNLYTTVTVNDRANLFLTVNNLLDRDPPPSPYPILNTPVNGQYYDKIGRAFQVGVNVKF
jgi:iron complex outermembrane receptor protein